MTGFNSIRRAFVHTVSSKPLGSTKAEGLFDQLQKYQFVRKEIPTCLLLIVIIFIKHI